MIEYWREWAIGLGALLISNVLCALLVWRWVVVNTISPEEMAAIKKKWKAQKKALKK